MTHITLGFADRRQRCLCGISHRAAGGHYRAHLVTRTSAQDCLDFDRKWKTDRYTSEFCAECLAKFLAEPAPAGRP